MLSLYRSPIHTQRHILAAPTLTNKCRHSVEFTNTHPLTHSLTCSPTQWHSYGFHCHLQAKWRSVYRYFWHSTGVWAHCPLSSSFSSSSFCLLSLLFFVLLSVFPSFLVIKQASVALWHLFFHLPATFSAFSSLPFSFPFACVCMYI